MPKSEASFDQLECKSDFPGSTAPYFSLVNNALLLVIFADSFLL
jgi:hypothetical protein